MTDSEIFDQINELYDKLSKFKPFDVVIYKPTNEMGIVKSYNSHGVFILFGIQSTAKLCRWEDVIEY